MRIHAWSCCAWPRSRASNNACRLTAENVRNVPCSHTSSLLPPKSGNARPLSLVSTAPTASSKRNYSRLQQQARARRCSLETLLTTARRYAALTASKLSGAAVEHGLVEEGAQNAPAGGVRERRPDITGTHVLDRRSYDAVISDRGGDRLNQAVRIPRSWIGASASTGGAARRPRAELPMNALRSPRRTRRRIRSWVRCASADARCERAVIGWRRLGVE